MHEKEIGNLTGLPPNGAAKLRSCKQIAELHARSMEEGIPLLARMEVGMHYFMCKMCRRFRRDMSILGRVVRDFDSETGVAADEALSPESRQRINAEINRHIDA